LPDFGDFDDFGDFLPFGDFGVLGECLCSGLDPLDEDDPPEDDGLDGVPDEGLEIEPDDGLELELEDGLAGLDPLLELELLELEEAELEEEKPPKPTSGECKDFSAILGADSIFTVECAAAVSTNKDKCAITCPAGSFFNGKDGKEGTEISCKCKGSKCKWVNVKGKTINGKEVAKWACE